MIPFITFEGPDGCGKTTLSKQVYENLIAHHACLWTRNPSRRPLGNLLVEQLKQNSMPPETALLVFLADRHEHYTHVIQPALKEKNWVLCDRFMDSTLVYQSYLCGLDVDALDKWVHAFGWFPKPDRTYLVSLDYETQQKRVSNRADASANDEAGKAFFDEISSRYQFLSDKEPERFMIVDGKAPLATLVAQISQDILRLWGEGE